MKQAAIVVLLLIASGAYAQETVVPPEVISVTTIGRWHAGSISGSYRLIVTRDGWEHVWSHVSLEWLPDPASREAGYLPGKAVELIPPLAQGTAVLEASARQGKSGELSITVVATSNMSVRARPRRFVYLAKGPGIVNLIGSAPRK